MQVQKKNGNNWIEDVSQVVHYNNKHHKNN